METQRLQDGDDNIQETSKDTKMLQLTSSNT
jgi:hypothetical protein